ncbi:MAG: ABC transporter ATP-binding protein [Candidatus Zixiibacteriota bacterium]|nr:MAG: ABC transporter ATP-binding protein [candidate division Zixibacteria bacterium]HDL02925.1 ATP-binding cassette domain-containing protein [candidate division Zixibacteria bacterium]
MIEFRNVNYSIEGKQIIKNVSFFIPDGESRVIMGQSGSGKSTILRLILGLTCPDSGDILIEGQNICHMKIKDLRNIRKRIGMVFQDGALFDSLTVGENIGYYLFEYSKMKLEEIDAKVREMLGFVGLSDEIIDHLPDQLSGGMQRRVAIGRALLSTDPKIMLYDEPTTGLDPQMIRNIISLINRLAEVKRVTSIVVTHQISDAFELSNKFIIIDSGRVAFDGSMIELIENKDQRVVKFLEPFREAVANVRKIDFI